MSEWLTTVEVISKLKIGEIAEPDDGNKSECILKRVDGSIVWKYNTDKFVHLNKAVMITKWRILPNFISFEEAMKALKEGKEVRFQANNNYTYRIISNMHFNALKNDGIVWEELLNGKWTVEE